MNLVRARLIATETNGGSDLDERRSVGDGLGGLHGGEDRIWVCVTILDDKSVPSVGLIPRLDILGEGKVGLAVDGDLVIVVENDELPELQMTRQRRSLP